MPARSKRPCAKLNCPELVTPPDRHCPEHKHLDRRYDLERPSAAARGYDRQWDKARLQFLRNHPLCECEECKGSEHPEIAEVVDHRTPHKGDPKLFWDRKNWQAMSKRHHDRKTAREDGAFGRPVKPRP